MLSWMAWTLPTALIFVALFCTMGVLTYLEIKHPGGDERKGALGLTTTRGDRLFLTCLGSSFIFLAWLGLMGTPLWVPLFFAMCWAGFCFWKV